MFLTFPLTAKIYLIKTEIKISSLIFLAVSLAAKILLTMKLETFAVTDSGLHCKPASERLKIWILRLLIQKYK